MNVRIRRIIRKIYKSKDVFLIQLFGQYVEVANPFLELEQGA